MAPIRVALAGCGNVSEHYLADMRGSGDAEVVAVCDVVPERAARRAAEFGVPHHYDSVEAMLAGPPFDLLVNLTAMPAHYAVNLAGLEAGCHVLCEKPIASTREEGRRLLETAQARGGRLYGAPITVVSPAFACLAGIVASGGIGAVHAAHGRYGHPGPTWGPWFYRKGGGSLLDLGVYNITTLTGLLGPAKAVVACEGVAVPEREIEGERVQVEADDNVALVIDHGNAVFSCIQTGFVYGPHRDAANVEIIGTRGSAYMLGWDWEPYGVEVWNASAGAWETRCRDQGAYSWHYAATYVAECLAAGREPLCTGEHAYHVLDVMLAAHESAAEGRRVEVTSTFRWPVPV